MLLTKYKHFIHVVYQYLYWNLVFNKTLYPLHLLLNRPLHSSFFADHSDYEFFRLYINNGCIGFCLQQSLQQNYKIVMQHISIISFNIS